MIHLSQHELSEICNHLGESRPNNIKRIYGGSINEAWKLEFNKKCIFAKRNKKGKKLLKFEEICLKDLGKYVDQEYLIIPKVIGYLLINNVEVLLIEWINFNNNDQSKLGKGLGLLHLNSSRNNQSDFGYSVKGFIGTTEQIQGWERNWADCFLKLRINPQLSFLKKDFLEINLIEKVRLKILLLLQKHQPDKSLVHGDLWSGNVGIGTDNKGIIFDPACWWADSEVDIAMTKLFGGFKDEFYKSYNEVIRPKEGAEERIIIYNFYHILNHANIFGGNYFNQVKNYIEIILSM